MRSKMTTKFSSQLRERAVRMEPEQEAQRPSRWVTIFSIAPRTGCMGQTPSD